MFQLETGKYCMCVVLRRVAVSAWSTGWRNGWLTGIERSGELRAVGCPVVLLECSLFVNVYSVDRKNVLIIAEGSNFLCD